MESTHEGMYVGIVRRYTSIETYKFLWLISVLTPTRYSFNPLLLFNSKNFMLILTLVSNFDSELKLGISIQ